MKGFDYFKPLSRKLFENNRKKLIHTFKNKVKNI